MYTNQECFEGNMKPQTYLHLRFIYMTKEEKGITRGRRKRLIYK